MEPAMEFCQVTVVGGALRIWTEAEKQQLFDAYFGPSEGMCPVCGHVVSMTLTYLGRIVTLLLTCEGCCNKASVSRVLPVEGPLRPGPVPAGRE